MSGVRSGTVERQWAPLRLAVTGWNWLIAIVIMVSLVATAALPDIVPLADALLLLTLGVWCWLAEERPALSSTDVAVAALLLTAMPRAWLEGGVVIDSTASVCRGIAVYWLLRTVLRPDFVLRALGLVVGVGAAGVSLIAIAHAHKWVTALRSVGFTDALPFKATLRSPFGDLVNEWATILLLCMVLQLAAIRVPAHWSLAKILGIGSAFLIASALFLTFSRGTYLALAAFEGGLLLFAVARRWRAGFMICVILLLTMWCAVVSMNALSAGSVARATTLSGSEQQRGSNRGRIEVWSSAARLACTKPLLGIGPGQFALRYLPLANLGAGRAFVGRPMNTALGILIESGLVGLALYLFVGIGVCRTALRCATSVRPARAWPAAVLLSGMAAFAIREASFSSLVENRTVMLLYWLLSGLMAACLPQLRQQRAEPVVPGVVGRVLFFAAVALSGSVLVLDYQWARAGSLAEGAAVEINRSDLNAALPYADRAVAIDPSPYHFSLRALARAKTYMPHFDGRSPVTVAETADARRQLRAALADLGRALEGSPDDDLFLHNRAWIRLALGERLVDVRGDLERSIQIDGAAPEHRVGLGLAEERSGDCERAGHEYAAALSFAPEIADSRFAIELRSRDLPLWKRCVKEASSCLHARDPEGRDTRILAGLARLQMEEGELEAARRMLRTATTAMPQFPRAWSNLAFLEFRRGDWLLADTAARRAVLLDGAYCPARMLLAQMERNYGNEDTAARIEAICLNGEMPCASGHAGRVGRLYKVRGWVVPDDVLPPGLLGYCTPCSVPELRQAAM